MPQNVEKFHGRRPFTGEGCDAARNGFELDLGNCFQILNTEYSAQRTLVVAVDAVGPDGAIYDLDAPEEGVDHGQIALWTDRALVFGDWHDLIEKAPRQALAEV